VPTYEYRCKACGQELEVVQSFSDDPLTACEACGGLLRKLFGNVGIAFKGSGFYKNDSRGTSSATAGGGDKGGESGSGSSEKNGDGASPGKDAGAKAKPDAAAAPSTSSTPKPDKAKTSSTTT